MHAMKAHELDKKIFLNFSYRFGHKFGKNLQAFAFFSCLYNFRKARL